MENQRQLLAFQTRNVSERESTSLSPSPSLSAVTDATTIIPGVRPGGNLICYSCKLDFRKKPYEWNHPCLGRHSNFRVSELNLVHCGPNDTSCRVERTEVNGVLIMLKRECTDLCYDSCRPKGFGIKYELCERCCSTDRCNDFYPTSRVTKTLPSAWLTVVVLGWWWVVVQDGPPTLSPSSYLL